jgi:predicted nucleic-acid-binding Zn-ribbon protein/peroxiredoxin
MTTNHAELASEAPVEPEPQLGGAATDLKLKPVKGKTVALSSLWTAKPLVLAFCGRLESAPSAEQVLLLRDANEAFDHVGATVACVTSTFLEKAAAFAKEHELAYTLFCDAGTAYEAYGVAADVPATFVIDSSGVVRYVHRGVNPFDQASTWDLAEAVAALTGATVERPKLVEPVLSTDEGWAGSALARSATPPALRSFEFTCAKCGNTGYEKTTVSTSGGFISRLFNFQYRRFTAVSCTACGYSELYKGEAGALANAADIALGG